MRTRHWLAGGMLLAANLAWAAEPAGEGEHTWSRYLGVLGTYGFLDNARAPNIKDSTGLQLLYGAQRDDGWGYELQGYGGVQETGDNSGADFYRWGLGGDLVYAFGDRFTFTPFLLAGGGYGFNDVAPNQFDDWSWFANLGLGFVTAPQLWDFFRIRGELRGLYDHYGDSISGDGYIDYQAGLGVEFLLTPLPPPRVEEVVRVVEVATGVSDTDGDGIVDERDRCPDTAPGARVDGTGCPLPRIWRLNGVTFEFDQARLRPDSRTILKDVAATLLRYPDMQVEVAGHTDSRGSEDYNRKLSQRRAESVRTHLIGLGVPAAQMQARGYGEVEPVETNDTDAGREHNRRVELRIAGGSGEPALKGKP